MINVSPKNKQMAYNQVYTTKHAKYMTLSVLEASLPMQRNHDTLAWDISA